MYKKNKKAQIVDLECTRLCQRANFVYFTVLRNPPSPYLEPHCSPLLRQETHAYLGIFFGSASGLGVDQNNETRRGSQETDTSRQKKIREEERY